MKWKSELDLAAQASAEAASYLRDAFGRERRVLSEIGRDIKLQADRDAEERILAVLHDSGYAVLAEESGESGALDGEGPVWIVDPLDGTLNYKHGIPLCCVSIALSVAGRPVLGIIEDFNRDERYTGIVGEGAWLNGATMEVSGVDDASKGILATGFPTKLHLAGEVIGDFAAAAQRFKKVRMLGSAALMMAYVACGRADAYAEDDIMYWDIAAGAALVEAAGGWISMTSSATDRWTRRVRCGSSPKLWPQG